ncbi:FkbM family methyltransferase [Fulvivirga ligni]|uniref:FkbM family methyltransferase n=1 Tax=Fulvivirga ligni TaxID=2904246 RepID=UPI001F241E70|nr:FkbM family methyltransferase [Fulvivirga ligni]UII23672.1 FkbM family methyltransferase [Fulvivirga ligni]
MSAFSKAQKIYHSVTPKFVRTGLVPIFTKIHRKIIFKKVISYLEAKASLSNEEYKALEYLKKNGLTVFPGNYQDKYKDLNIDIQVDVESGLKYVIHNSKRLYFKRTMSSEKIHKMYRGLTIEQDPESPHRYTDSLFKIEPKDVVVEAGSAEASFSLDAVEEASKIYIFETDPLWIEALEHTFKPWGNKVTIFNKFVTSSTGDNSISLDDIVKEYGPIDFVKIDVDGEEMNLLKGFDKTLSDKNTKTKIAICTYHKQEDEHMFTQYFKNKSYSSRTTDNYMLFYFDNNFVKPYLRRGVLRAYKS